MGSQLSTDLSLEWNAELIPKGGKLDTQVHPNNKNMIVRGTGSNPIVRTKESITKESGRMTWRMRCGASDGRTNKYFYLGVVSADYLGTKHNHPGVWLCCGDGKYWHESGAVYTDVHNEAANNQQSYMFMPGDVVEMTFDPITQLLTATVEGKEGWSTTRRLEGEGVKEVHPCARLGSGAYLNIEILGRRGLSKQDWEQLNNKIKSNVHLDQSLLGMQPQTNKQLDVQIHPQEQSQSHQQQSQQQAERQIPDEVGHRVDLLIGAMTGMMQELATMRLGHQQIQEGIVQVQHQVTEVQNEVKQLQSDQQRHEIVQRTILERLETLQNQNQNYAADVAVQRLWSAPM